MSAAGGGGVGGGRGGGGIWLHGTTSSRPERCRGDKGVGCIEWVKLDEYTSQKQFLLIAHLDTGELKGSKIT